MAAWFPVLADAKTLEPFMLFGADVGESRDLCAEFLKQFDECAVLTPDLKEAAGAIRAILADLNRQQASKSLLNPQLQGPGLEPDFLEILKRGRSAGRSVMFGAYVGKSSLRCEAVLRLCEANADPVESLEWVAGAVRILASQPKFNTGAIHAPALRREMRRFPPLRRVAMLSAVGTAIVAIAAVLSVYLVQQWGWESYATKVGDYRRVPLTDGSTVELNTHSKVRYRESADRWEVHLDAGEARFKVVHSTARVFVVYARDLVIEDVGTAFSVRLREDGRVDVVVSEGEVAVHRKRLSIVSDLLPSIPTLSTGGAHVTAGHIATNENGRLLLDEISAAEIDDREAWRNNVLFFTDMSIGDVVNELNRYSQRQIRIADSALGATILGGRLQFNPRDLDGTLSKLKRLVPIQVSKTSGSAEVVIRQGAETGRQ
ncbi:MAG: FecR domain-containing protein [Gammaproteobacteria bacterium]